MVNELETWYPIKDFEGLYEVSDYGRIKALNYKNRGILKILQLSAKEGKYLEVGLHKEGKTYYKWVHRLVAETFLPSPQEGQTQINHINGDKQDNRLCNLEWTTAKENCRNPNTKQNYHRRYHKEGEFERRSQGQKRRWNYHRKSIV